MNTNCITVLLGLLAIQCASADRTDEQSAKTLAKAFVLRIEPSGIPTEPTRDRAERHTIGGFGAKDEPIWRVELGRFRIGIDERTGQVKEFKDTVTANQISKESVVTHWDTSFYRFEGDVVTRARQWARAAGWTLGSDVRKNTATPPDSRGNVPLSVVYVTFYEKPNGIHVNDGNSCLIGMDSRTGKVIDAVRVYGFTYEPGPIRVSKENAIRIASGAIDIPPRPVVGGPDYQTLRPDGVLSARGSDVLASRTVPLDYRVVGTDEIAIVDAVTGDFLCHFRKPILGSDHLSSDPRTAPSSTANLSNSGSITRFNGLAAVAAFVLVFAGAFAFLKRTSAGGRK